MRTEETTLKEMTLKEIIEPILDDIQRKTGNKETQLYDIVISFRGIATYKKIDYNSIIVEGTVRNEEVSYEVWFNKTTKKFELANNIM